MRTRVLILAALIVQGIFFVFLLFSAPERNGFLKGAMRDLFDESSARMWTNASNLQGRLAAEVTSAIKIQGILVQLTFFVSVVTMITLVFAFFSLVYSGVDPKTAARAENNQASAPDAPHDH